MSAGWLLLDADPVKLDELQRAEWPYFDYLHDPSCKPLPAKQSKSAMRHFYLYEGKLFKLYLLSHLRKRSDFRDQLVVPSTFRSLVVTTCHDLPASGGALIFQSHIR